MRKSFIDRWKYLPADTRNPVMMAVTVATIPWEHEAVVVQVFPYKIRNDGANSDASNGCRNLHLQYIYQAQCTAWDLYEYADHNHGCRSDRAGRDAAAVTTQRMMSITSTDGSPGARLKI